MSVKVINIRDAQPGWERMPQYIYIGRAGRGHDGYFGNPFPLTSNEQRGATIERYTYYLLERLDEDDEFAKRFWSLPTNAILVCFCKPHACHGDVMANMLNTLR